MADIVGLCSAGQSLAAGLVVKIKGLLNAPQHNDSLGVLVSINAETGRWSIRPTRGRSSFSGGVSVLRVKPGNLTVVSSTEKDLGVITKDWVSPASRGKGKSTEDLLAALRNLGAGEDPKGPGEKEKRHRTSLAKHLSKFTPNGEAWLIAVKVYMAIVEKGDKIMWDTLQSMAESTCHSPTVATRSSPEATLAKYLCGKLLKCSEGMGALRMKTNEIKAAWYWVSAAEDGFAFAICGLAQLLRDGIPMANLSVDLDVAKLLWAKAFSLCDLPEAAHNLGVCYGLGHGGVVDLPMAIEWYGAAKDCDLSGAYIGDTPGMCMCVCACVCVRVCA